MVVLAYRGADSGRSAASRATGMARSIASITLFRASADASSASTKMSSGIPAGLQSS